MFPLVEQNFNSEELQTGKTHEQEIFAAMFEMLQWKQTSSNPRLESQALLGTPWVKAALTRFEHLPHENLTSCQLLTSSWLEGVKYKAATGRTQVAAIVVANSWGISVLLWHRAERAEFQCDVALTFLKVRGNEGSKWWTFYMFTF